VPGCPVVTAGVRTGPAAAGLPVECALCLLGDGDGHGLGLAIVRAIAAAHKAAVRVTAGSEGGLDIEVSFP